ncbi:MAG: tetratricopeptide repeat protein [Alphaproteobacteria bacterium]|nr:tetratricopeptide repeat protein [Alphaproteobacteria bacterium]
MPIALFAILLEIMLLWHAAKTGRLQTWGFLLLFFPVGPLAYFVVEIIPEWLGSADAQKARKRIASKLDPEKRYRELSDHLVVADTVAGRAALAEECMEVGRFTEAEKHFDHALNQYAGDIPAYAFGKARAQFAAGRASDALATLDELQRRWPDFHSAPAHLLYARALAEAGRSDEACAEYRAVTAYFPGAEARVRHGLLLQQLGHSAEARSIFSELLIQMRRAPRHVRKAQAEWLALAEKQIST